MYLVAQHRIRDREGVREHVDSTLGDASDNRCHEVDADQAFAEQPLGLAAATGTGA